jgi:hypothetical protein
MWTGGQTDMAKLMGALLQLFVVKSPKYITSQRWLSSGSLRRVIWYKFTDVSEVLAAFIIRAITQKTAVFILAAVRTSNLILPGVLFECISCCLALSGQHILIEFENKVFINIFSHKTRKTN